MGQKGSNQYIKKQLDIISKINEGDSQEFVENLNQDPTYQEMSIQSKNKQKENNVEFMDYGEENASIVELNNNSPENSDVVSLAKIFQLKKEIDSKKLTENRAIKKLYKIYKSFKSDLDDTRSKTFDNIKKGKNNEIYDICVALKNACAEENEARGNCGITAAAMAHYYTLSSYEMKSLFRTCSLNQYCTSIDYDLSFKSQNQNRAEKLCDMDNYCFGMFLYYYANKFNNTDPNKAKFFSDKYNSDIEKVLNA